MTTFNIGDQIVCRDAAGTRGLIEGKLYTVMGRATCAHVCVVNDFGVVEDYWRSRFRAARRAPCRRPHVASQGHALEPRMPDVALSASAIEFNAIKKRNAEFIDSLSSEQRKELPLTTGVLDYFPLALLGVAKLSKQGNDKHNPGQPLHWARGKSMDQDDTIGRHLLTRDLRGADGMDHDLNMLWRTLARVQLRMEAMIARGENPFA